MQTLWLTNAELLEDELNQAAEEGRETGGMAERIAAVRTLPPGEQEAKAAQLMDDLAALPMQKGYLFHEPSDLEAIRAARPNGPRRLGPHLGEEQLYDRIYGAWLGRCAGCLLGKPVEGYAMQKQGRRKLKDYLVRTHAYPLEGYFNFQVDEALLQEHGFTECHKAFNAATIGRMPEDDDTNYTALGLRILQTYGPDFKPEDVAEAWLSHLPLLHTCTAERVAYRNLANLVLPPASAVYHNPYREWIGAQIRADIWGYVTPGDPEHGAELAWRDASISHVKNGIYGEMFVAAMLSSAFACRDLLELIEIGLSEIPAGCRLATAMRALTVFWRRNQSDWEAGLDWIHENYGGYHPVNTINNALLVAAGLLYGKLDFTKSICIAVMGAWDTDCNGATAGSILGAVLGAGALPEKWTEPLRDTIETGVHGYNSVAISRLAQDTVKIALDRAGGFGGDGR